MAYEAQKIQAKQIDAKHKQRPDAPQEQSSFEMLARTIWRLRQSDGCPWDREQTNKSIASSLIEEAYEAKEAAEQENAEALLEELGDLLELVLLHTQIAADAGLFTLDELCERLNAKLIFRHPHVFGERAATQSDEVLDLWDEVKAQERAGEKGLLDSIPKSLPALMQAQKISKRAAKEGFEWPDTEAVWAQVEEEKQEFLQEKQGSAAAELEFGDMLFALVNVARREGISAEAALEASNAKFRSRWAYMEALAKKDKGEIKAYSVDELNQLWKLAKEAETKK